MATVVAGKSTSPVMRALRELEAQEAKAARKKKPVVEEPPAPTGSIPMATFKRAVKVLKAAGAQPAPKKTAKKKAAKK